ncbi:MAG: NADH-quinone oxidoreductase subunit A [Armatimonadota bacterium]|nr:NADH-quinone oxidoreductase subunit A [Armatimonadota bacterium]
MLAHYGVVAVAVAIGLLTAGAFLLISHLSSLVGEGKPKEAKLSPYECGVEPVGDARQRFPVKFYVVAMLFIIFDVEIVFFYPWALQFRELGLLGFWAMAIFVTILVVGYLYLLRTGAFEWEWWEERPVTRALEEAVPVGVAQQGTGN